ncbi:MAG: peptidylprolyl isomerase, partial [Rickettsiales bacterium]|nr:peptidylprolyl isomerase [Rickettsiales bacterium]
MLKKLGNIFGSILIILSILAFAVWGIGDVFRGFSSNVIATVGDKDITQGELDQAVRSEMARMQKLYGPQATQFFPEEQVRRSMLYSVINRNLLIEAAKQAGIYVGKDIIVDEVRQFPGFHDADGKFNTDMFRGYLRSQGVSEDMFFNSLREDRAIAFLLDSFSSTPLIPASLLKMMAAYDQETRNIEVMTFPAGYIKEAPEPSEGELLQYYEARKDTFATPEYRELTYLA